MGKFKNPSVKGTLKPFGPLFLTSPQVKKPGIELHTSKARIEVSASALKPPQDVEDLTLQARRTFARSDSLVNHLSELFQDCRFGHCNVNFGAS